MQKRSGSSWWRIWHDEAGKDTHRMNKMLENMEGFCRVWRCFVYSKQQQKSHETLSVSPSTWVGHGGFRGSFIFGLAFFGGFFFGSSPIGSRGELPENNSSIAGLKSLQLTFDQAAIPWRDGDWWLHLADKNGSERMDADEETCIKYLFLVVSLQCCLFWLLLGRKFAQTTKKPPSFFMTSWVSFPLRFLPLIHQPKHQALQRYSAIFEATVPEGKARCLKTGRGSHENEEDDEVWTVFIIFSTYSWQMRFFSSTGAEKRSTWYMYMPWYIFHFVKWMLLDEILRWFMSKSLWLQDPKTNVLKFESLSFKIILCVCQILKNLLKII